MYRDPEVVLLFSTMVERLGNEMTTGIPTIFAKLAVCTLEMIGADFANYPDHRMNYFLLINNIVRHCFQSLFMLGPDNFKVVVNSILWAIKHESPKIAEIGLNTLAELIRNINLNQELINQFYALFLMPICSDIFLVLTDSLHKSGFKQQAEILRQLIFIIESKQLTVSIDATCPDNKSYIRNYLITALITSFPNMSKTNVTAFVDAMFANCTLRLPFKTVVRDFLITMKEFAEDSELLYSEERQVLFPPIV
jgi:exportin-1